jgi:putative hydrolase of the HAD superfamily
VSIRYLLFDLDETLYARDAGVMQAIRKRIRQYIEERYGLSAGEADALARRYHETYGTSMRGLLLHNNLNADEFLAYVHDFPLDGLIAASPELDAMLASLPGQKVIFTNASREHAERVLAQLGIGHHFQRIVDVTAVGYVSKPNPEAYSRCLSLLEAEPGQCVLIEDAARNLAPAAQLGMVTVLVDGDRREAADFYVDAILELPAVVEAICRAGACPDAGER